MNVIRILLALVLAAGCRLLSVQPLAAQPLAETPVAQAAEPVMVIHRQTDISKLKAATVPYGQAGLWSIRIDQVAGYGCFMAAQYDNNTGIRFQFSPGDNSNIIYVSSSDWRSVKEGDKKNLSISFEGKNTWSGAALGIDVEGMHWLSLKASGAMIFEEMKAAEWFALKIDALEFGVYEAGDIGKAVAMLKACQAVADVAVDPFARKPAGPPKAN